MPAYDFSQESVIKESLFADMQRVYTSSKRQTAQSREAMSLEELARSEIRPGKIASPKARDLYTPAPKKDLDKS